MIGRLLKVSAALVLIGSLSGCSVLKASPAKEIRFLQSGTLLKESSRAPFNGYWVSEPQRFFLSRKARKQIYIAPVNTEIVEAEILQRTKEERNRTRLVGEIRELARYFRERLRLNMQNRTDMLLTPVTEPSPDALTLELALVEVTPTNPGINLIGTAAGFVFPGGGLIKRAGVGSVAFEGQIKDGTLIVEQFRDRESDKSAPATIKDYQKFAHIREALDDWAMQLTELENTPPRCSNR